MNTGREWLLWSIGILVVLLYALIPVIWIASLSLKTPEQVGDKFFSGLLVRQLRRRLLRRHLHRRADQLDRHCGDRHIISIVLAAMAAYATSRLDFTGKTLILSGALAVAMFPPISIVGSLFDMWRAIGLYDTWLG